MLKDLVENLVREKFETRGYTVVCVWNDYQKKYLIGHFEDKNKAMTRIAYDVMNEVSRDYPQAFTSGTIEDYNRERTPIVFCMKHLVQTTLRDCRYEFK